MPFEAPRLLRCVKRDARFQSDLCKVTAKSPVQQPGCWTHDNEFIPPTTDHAVVAIPFEAPRLLRWVKPDPRFLKDLRALTGNAPVE